MTESSSDWSNLTATPGNTLYCWFPGWSFSATVFAPLYQQLPGTHIGTEFIAQGSMSDYGRQLAQTLMRKTDAEKPDRVVFIGWSLGGAAAVYCLQAFQNLSNIPCALMTLACGERFLQDDDHCDQGMAEKTFSAFARGLQASPEKTAKRFLSLCTQHADTPRELMRLLAAHQVHDKAVLQHSLQWLNYSTLPIINAPQQHIYSARDEFNPRRISPNTHSTAPSHCFFLTEVGQSEFLHSLHALAKVQELF